MSDKLTAPAELPDEPSRTVDVYVDANGSRWVSDHLFTEWMDYADALRSRLAKWENWKPDDKQIAEWAVQSKTSLAAAHLLAETYRSRLAAVEGEIARLNQHAVDVYKESRKRFLKYQQDAEQAESRLRGVEEAVREACVAALEQRRQLINNEESISSWEAHLCAETIRALDLDALTKDKP